MFNNNLLSECTFQSWTRSPYGGSPLPLFLLAPEHLPPAELFPSRLYEGLGEIMAICFLCEVVFLGGPSGLPDNCCIFMDGKNTP